MFDWNQIVIDIGNTTILEWIAVLTGLIYVILITLKKIAAWIFALISSIIYCYLCVISDYYLESGLQIYYIFMAIYGWFSWKNVKSQSSFIQVWNWKQHLFNIFLSGTIMLLLGWFFDNYTNQSLPYLDSFTTVFSLAATFMVTKRVLENWIYWIIIDLVSIQLYSFKGFHLTSFLFLFYTLIALIGFIKWRKLYKAQKA